MKLFVATPPVSPGSDDQRLTISRGVLFCLPFGGGFKQPFFKEKGLTVQESAFKQGQDPALECSEEFFQIALNNQERYIRPDGHTPSYARLIEASMEIVGSRASNEPLLRLVEPKRESDLAFVLLGKRYATEVYRIGGISPENVLGEIARSPDRPPDWIALMMHPYDGVVVKSTVKVYSLPPFKLFGGKRDLLESYDLRTDYLFYDGNTVSRVDSEQQLNQLRAFHQVSESESRVID